MGIVPGSLSVLARGDYPPPGESYQFGFRVAMIPEPSTALLLACGLAGLAAVGRRRDGGGRCTRLFPMTPETRMMRRS